MAVNHWLIVDVASAPIPDVASYLEGTVKAPANYKDAEKIAAYVAEKEAERAAMAATDVDLGRLTALGQRWSCDRTSVAGSVETEEHERTVLASLAVNLKQRPTLVTFGGFNFDLPFLMRRARYLGVPFPAINLDRYKSPHLDLCELLADRNPQRRRSLDFYVRRMGWTDLWPKPLSGADEARVHETGAWDQLVESVRRDVEATYRLAVWAGVIEPVAEPKEDAEEPVV